MEQRRIKLSKKEFDSGEIPYISNHVLIEMVFSSDGVKTKSGIIVGFNKDVNYAEGSDAHDANLQEVWGVVARAPEKLYYNEDDPDSMEWECDMELEVGDKVWGGIMEFANAQEILCEDKLYKLIPYADLYVAKRETWVKRPDPAGYDVERWGGEEIIPLNGYILCQTVKCRKMSDLDYFSEMYVDQTRCIVKYVGKPNKRYKSDNKVDFADLRPEDEIVLVPRTPFQFLERKTYMSAFNGDNLYIVLPRRKVSFVLNR